MYIDFYEYPPYSGRMFGFFETNVNKNIQCDYGYNYSSVKNKICTRVDEVIWEMMKTCFPDAKQIKNPQNHFMQTMYIWSNI